MKKSKLLIPALSIASIGAVVAPIATSCAAKNTNIVDLSKYESQIKRYVDDPSPDKTLVNNVGRAADAYWKSENINNIIKNDLLVYLSTETDILKQYLKEYEELIEWLELDVLGKFNVTNAEIKDVSVSEVNGQNARISGKITLWLDADILEKAGSVKTRGRYTLTTTHEIKDVPYKLIIGTIAEEPQTYYRYSCQLQRNSLSSDEKWSIKRSYQGNATYTDGTKSEDTGLVSDTWNKSNVPGTSPYDPLMFLNFYSDYLFDIKNTHA